MYRLIEERIRTAISAVRETAKARQEITPSDVAPEAMYFAANAIERALNEALRDTEMLTPTQYAQLHNITPQTVTRWIRIGKLAAEVTANGYLIARDAETIDEPVRRKSA